MAIDAGHSAYAGPLGFLEAGTSERAGRVPLILKVNSHGLLKDEIDPCGVQTASNFDVLRLGCVGIGCTIYSGIAHRCLQWEQSSWDTAARGNCCTVDKDYDFLFVHVKRIDSAGEDGGFLASGLMSAVHWDLASQRPI